MIEESRKQHGLVPYFLVAFAFTWSLHFSISLTGVPFSLDLSNPGMVLYLIGLAGPLVAGITVSAWLRGGAGVSALLGQCLIWRFPVRWYLAAILTMPAINLANVLLFYDKAPPDLGWLVIVPVLIIGQIWVVVAEEFGWRGFALPRLQDRFGSLGATLILAPLWSLWHLPMFFIQGSPQYSENVPEALAVYIVITCFLSVMITAIYNRSGGSVLACMLFHAFLNIAAFTIRVPPDANITIYMIAAVALISVFFLDRPWFGSKRQR